MIVVVGSINLDLIANVGRLPMPGETVPANGFSTAPGGKGANQALAARRAGAEVMLAGAVGADAFGEQALKLLRQDGVDLTRVRTANTATGIAMIMVGDDGENIIAIVPGGNGTVSPQDAKGAAPKRGDHVLLQLEIPLESVASALDAARAADAVSILNIAPFREDALPLLVQADIVVANETEFDLVANALSLAGANRAQRMRDFSARTGRTIVVTLGAEGVAAAAPNGFFEARGLAIAPVDTVGAGDTFCGYLAASLQSGLELEAALGRAAAAGSLACLKHGAQPSIPLAAEVDAALKSK